MDNVSNTSFVPPLLIEAGMLLEKSELLDLKVLRAYEVYLVIKVIQVLKVLRRD